MKHGSLIVLAALSINSADARCYSVWKYPWAQKCNAHVAQMDVTKPTSILPFPPPKPVPSEPLYIEGDDPLPDADTIPLPSLENMEFPPDCLADWCQRLKGVGMLRDRLGTN